MNEEEQGNPTEINEVEEIGEIREIHELREAVFETHPDQERRWRNAVLGEKSVAKIRQWPALWPTWGYGLAGLASLLVPTLGQTRGVFTLVDSLPKNISWGMVGLAIIVFLLSLGKKGAQKEGREEGKAQMPLLLFFAPLVLCGLFFLSRLSLFTVEMAPARGFLWGVGLGLLLRFYSSAASRVALVTIGAGTAALCGETYTLAPTLWGVALGMGAVAFFDFLHHLRVRSESPFSVFPLSLGVVFLVLIDYALPHNDAPTFWLPTMLGVGAVGSLFLWIGRFAKPAALLPYLVATPLVIGVFLVGKFEMEDIKIPLALLSGFLCAPLLQKLGGKNQTFLSLVLLLCAFMLGSQLGNGLGAALMTMGMLLSFAAQPAQWEQKFSLLPLATLLLLYFFGHWSRTFYQENQRSHYALLGLLIGAILPGFLLHLAARRTALQEVTITVVLLAVPAILGLLFGTQTLPMLQMGLAFGTVFTLVSPHIKQVSVGSRSTGSSGGVFAIVLGILVNTFTEKLMNGYDLTRLERVKWLAGISLVLVVVMLINERQKMAIEIAKEVAKEVTGENDDASL
jgi:hypothetical protein